LPMTGEKIRLQSANCFLMLAISSLDVGQLASQVLQCRTKSPDFSTPSNSSREKVRVRLWLFGHTVFSSALIPRPRQCRLTGSDSSNQAAKAKAAGGGS
jgi:hypothetical protein